MKRATILLFSITFVSFFGTSQENTQEKSQFSPYVATGLSFSNTGTNQFSESVYPSIEGGMSSSDFSFGLAVGRGNLSNFKQDAVRNYWYEVKTAAYFPIGKLTGFGVLGIGNYIDTKKLFIEYGAGFGYAVKKTSFTVQASNWDGIWYVTPGICYVF